MANVCKSDLIDAATKFLSRKEAQDLVDEVENKVSERTKLKQQNLADAYGKTVDEIMQEEEDVNKVRKRQALLMMKTRRDRLEEIENFKSKGLGLIARLGGIQRGERLSRFSTATLQHARSAELLRRLSVGLEKDNVLADFNNAANAEQLAIALHDEEAEAPENIRSIARNVKQAYKDAIKLLNNAGANIKELKEYIARQSHDVEKIRRARSSFFEDVGLRAKLMKDNKGNYQKVADIMRDEAFDRWNSFTIDLLDADRTFKGEDPQEFMRSVFDALRTGVHNIPSDGAQESVFKFRLPGSRANRLSRSRVLHFKDGKSWFDYHQEYGIGSLHDAIVGGLAKSGENAALLEDWGPNPDAMLDSISSSLLKRFRTEKGIKRRLTISKWIMAELTGRTRIPADNLAGKIFRSLRTIQHFKLGLLLLISQNDYALKAALIREHGSSYLSPFVDGYKDFIKGKPKGELKRIADELGVWSDTSLGNTFMRFGNVDSVPGKLSQTMQLFFKLTGMQRHDEALRTGTGSWLARNIANKRNVKFSNLDPREQNRFRLYGIEDKEWKLIHNNPENFRLADNKLFVTPEIAQTFSKDAIAEYLDKDLKDLTSKEINDVKKTIEDRLRVFFIDSTDNVQIRPNAAQRALITQGTSPGSVAGEILRILGVFKSFTIGLTQRTLGRFVYGHGADNLYQAFVEGKGDIRGMVEFMLNSLALGYVSYASSSLAKGLNVPSVENPRTWTQAALAGGGLGIYTDLLLNQYNTYGRTFVDSFVGPVGNTVDDLAAIMSSITHAQNPTAATLKLLKKQTPFLNLPYTKLALDHLILNALSERVSPGSLERYQTLMENENNQGYWWAPTSHNLFTQ